jgi:hypothetical protein
MRLRVSVVAAVVVMIVLIASRTSADEQIPLIGGHITDEEWQIVTSLYGGEEVLADPLWVRRYPYFKHLKTVDEGLAAIREHQTFIGYYDLDRDGTDEMFVYFEYSCGNIGCSTDILKKVHQSWGFWQSVTVFEPPVLCATDDPSFGLPTLYSLFTAKWWNGSNYRELCLRKLYCDEEYKSDFERNLAKSLEDRPPCWDVVSGLPGSAGVATGSS